MEKTIKLLRGGFESSSQITPEFANFFKTFKKEFTAELNKIGATNIKFSRGHFSIYGFYTVSDKCYYFSISDVRGSEYQLPDLLYRTARNYNDYSGGSNNWVNIEPSMHRKMLLEF